MVKHADCIAKRYDHMFKAVEVGSGGWYVHVALWGTGSPLGVLGVSLRGGPRGVCNTTVGLGCKYR